MSEAPARAICIARIHVKADGSVTLEPFPAYPPLPEGAEAWLPIGTKDGDLITFHWWEPSRAD